MRRGVKWCASTVDLARQPRRGVIVLIYHRVGGASPIQGDLPLALFEEQMEVLAASGRVVSLDTALEMLRHERTASPDPVVVTFDDGTADFGELAVPVLHRFGVSATLYLATAFVESGRTTTDEGRPMSWHGLRDVLSTGLVAVGGHTHTHPRLDRLTAREAGEELDRSNDLIEDRLGLSPRHFAYPYSVLARPSVESVVRARFRSAALAGTRPNPYLRTDPYRLQRSPIQTADAMKYFFRKLEGGMWLEDILRHRLNPAPRGVARPAGMEDPV